MTRFDHLYYTLCAWRSIGSVIRRPERYGRKTSECAPTAVLDSCLRLVPRRTCGLAVLFEWCTLFAVRARLVIIIFSFKLRHPHKLRHFETRCPSPIVFDVRISSIGIRRLRCRRFKRKTCHPCWKAFGIGSPANPKYSSCRGTFCSKKTSRPTTTFG